jgi:predicted RNA-binding Zn-ribbon protein involved in translation (DUF1610 family)
MNENTLIRSVPCPECGAEMLWTQNAWRADDTANAAYRCPNGHVVDPATTKQCPACGLHDTTLLDEADSLHHKCLRCGQAFQVPR